jgi:hypothetical protein
LSDWRESARRCVESNKIARTRVHDGEARRRRLPVTREGAGIREIENHDARVGGKTAQRAGHVGQPHAVKRQIGSARNARARRNEIIFAVRLHAIAADIDEGHGV